MKLSGVRARLILLATVVAAPMLGLELWQAAQSRHHALDRASERVSELARLAASEEDDGLQEASTLLRVLKNVPAVVGGATTGCHVLLREITTEHPRLGTLTVVNPDGMLACTSLQAAPPAVNFADRQWFRDVTAPDAPSIVISEFLVSRTTGQPTVVVATGVGGSDSAVPRGAVAATMNLAWFSEIAARIPGASGASVVVMDGRDGSILARSREAVERVGMRFPTHELTRLVGARSEGSVRMPGLDGVDRIIGFRTLAGDPRAHTVVVVSLPATEVLAEANAQLRRGLSIVGMMLVLGMAAAWAVASFSILRPLAALGRAAQQLGEGDKASFAAMPALAVTEFGTLASVFNRAAEQIADRDHQLEHLAMQDSLTGLANRRSFDSALSREWQRAARTGRGVALVMVDVDHFKLFNDHYGHVAGDVCLQTVATAIADTVRQSTDTAARYGGEEFAIIIPDTDLIGAMRLADRLVKQINSLSVPHLGAPTGTLSVSAGVAAFIPPHGHHGAAALVEAADAALYRAKSAGRGRVASHRVDAAEIVI